MVVVVSFDLEEELVAEVSFFLLSVVEDVVFLVLVSVFDLSLSF